jgi:uncharacterized membrane protein YagU involved in acid resistance
VTCATTAQTNASFSVVVGVVAVIVVVVSSTIVATAAAVFGVCLHVSVFVIAAPLGRFIVDWTTDPPSQAVPVTPLNLYLIVTTILHAIADL